jgi:hypothetical protein
MVKRYGVTDKDAVLAAMASSLERLVGTVA